MPVCVFAQIGHITPENMVILNADSPYKSTWTPTEEQILKALSTIYEFIDNPTGINDWQKKEIAKIKKNLSLYRVQFVGIEIEGEKRIWCNFFSNDRIDYWKEGVVIVLDGGFWYWEIQYDVKTGECVNFISNGYA